jgi:hypothetical protein
VAILSGLILLGDERVLPWSRVAGDRSSRKIFASDSPEPMPEPCRRS